MKNFLLKTKGNYLQRGKKSAIPRYFIILLSAFLVLYSGQNIIGTLSSVVTTPIYFVRQYMQESSATIPVFFRSRLQLDHEIESLQQEIAKRQGYDATITFLMNENTELRTMLESSTTPRIVAGVISRPPQTPYDTMIIDRGSDDGIVENAPVFYGSNQAIGYVARIFDSYAHIILFSSPEIESTVFIFGPNIFTTAYGEGGGVIRLSIPQGITITEEDVVILPSLESGVLGTIDEIQSIASEPEQNAYIVLDDSLQSIRLVSIGTKPIITASIIDIESRITETQKSLFTFEIPQNLILTNSTSSSTVDTDGSTSTTREN